VSKTYMERCGAARELFGEKTREERERERDI
jgi:hypothetical protein